MKSYVYRNLHKHCWSVAQKQRVCYHARSLMLTDVEFRVRQGGWEKVIRERKKNVHAFVIGEVEIAGEVLGPVDRTGAVEVTYNPYNGNRFYRIDNGCVVYGAGRVIMEFDGDGRSRLWAFGLIGIPGFVDTNTKEKAHAIQFGSNRHEVQRSGIVSGTVVNQWEADCGYCDGLASKEQELEDGRVYSDLHLVC